jgi:diadenylate cyclase
MLEFLHIVWKPFVEIVIIASLYYMVFLFIRGTRAAQVVNGLLVFVIIYFLANFIGLQTLQWILSKIFSVAIIAFIVIFHPELRQGLANLGKRKFFVSASPQQKTIKDIVSAVFGLGSKKIGALIAVERKIGLGDYIDTGVVIDAELKPEMIQTIFMPNTPLHDGGAIISKNVLRAAGCIFPLSNRPLNIKHLGTRHRAGIGLSEETDAFVLIASEETGIISVATGGRLMHNVSEQRLTEMLTDILVPKKSRPEWRFWRHR